MLNDSDDNSSSNELVQIEHQLEAKVETLEAKVRKLEATVERLRVKIETLEADKRRITKLHRQALLAGLDEVEKRCRLEEENRQLQLTAKEARAMAAAANAMHAEYRATKVENQKLRHRFSDQK